jgi:hypothetical protein
MLVPLAVATAIHEPSPLQTHYPEVASYEQPPVAQQTMRCPFCDEQISSAAKKCKHCGETVDVSLRAAEEARRSAEKAPMVFMNAGGGASSAAVSYGHRRARQSPGTAAALELIFGLFFGTFGLGHMYAGNVVAGLVIMFGGWFVLFVNVLLCFVGIGFITLPLCWIAMLIASPVLAASSC